MTTQEQLEQLKSKYPLAFDTLLLPVKYDSGTTMVFDADGNMVIEIRGWGRIQYKSEPQQRQDQIGELICELLNQLK